MWKFRKILKECQIVITQNFRISDCRKDDQNVGLSECHSDCQNSDCNRKICRNNGQVFPRKFPTYFFVSVYAGEDCVFWILMAVMWASENISITAHTDNFTIREKPALVCVHKYLYMSCGYTSKFRRRVIFAILC